MSLFVSKLTNSVSQTDKLINRIKNTKSYLTNFFAKIIKQLKDNYDLSDEDEIKLDKFKMTCLNATNLNFKSELELLLVLRSKFKLWSKMIINNENSMNKEKIDELRLKFNLKNDKLKKVKDLLMEKIFLDKFDKLQNLIGNIRKVFYLNRKINESFI